MASLSLSCSDPSFSHFYPYQRANLSITQLKECANFCSSRSNVFASRDMLYNCLSFRDGLIRATEDPFYNVAITNGSYIPKPAIVAVAGVIDACMFQYCERPDSMVGGCPYNNDTALVKVSGTTTPFKEIVISNSLCVNVATQINVDIGGIGIFVSYVLQAALVAVAIVGILGLQLLLLPSIQRWLARRTPRLAEGISGQLAVLKSITVDVQETQCFLMLACQVAMLVAFDRRALLDVRTAASARHLSNITSVVALGGMLPVTLLLLVQEVAEMTSGYLFILSAFTIAVSYAVFAQRTKLEKDDTILTPTPNVGALDQCGGHSPPIVYCNNFNFNLQRIELLQRVAPILCVVVFFCIFNHYLWRRNFLSIRERSVRTATRLSQSMSTAASKRKSHSKPVAGVSKEQNPTNDDGIQKHAHGDLNLLPSDVEKRSTHSKLRKDLSALSRHWKNYVFYAITFSAFIFLSVLMGYYLACFGWILESGGVKNEWSFGQIVAMFVWLPIFTKYFHWAIFGMENHSYVRIAAPYEIVLTQTLYQSHNGR